jgi:hypothetical protein
MLLLPRHCPPLQESSYAEGTETKQHCSRDRVRVALSFETIVLETWAIQSPPPD